MQSKPQHSRIYALLILLWGSETVMGWPLCGRLHLPTTGCLYGKWPPHPTWTATWWQIFLLYRCPPHCTRTLTAQGELLACVARTCRCLLHSFFFGRTACRILVPRLGIEPASPALEARNLNLWTAREVPPPSHTHTLARTSHAEPPTLWMHSSCWHPTSSCPPS